MALRIVPSRNAARTDCAISMPTLSCASAVEAPRCGVRTRFGILRKVAVGREGLFFKNVERSRGYVAVAQSLGECLLVN